jgi:hypothetical protein
VDRQARARPRRARSAKVGRDRKARNLEQVGDLERGKPGSAMER